MYSLLLVVVVNGISSGSGTVPTVQVDPWGDNSIRIRWVLDGGTVVTKGMPGALDDITPKRSSTPWTTNIKATVSPTGLVTVTRVSDNKVLFLQTHGFTSECSGDLAQEGCKTKATLRFTTPPDEQLYGGKD